MPESFFTHGLTEPFDLVAPGGPDNVWIAEVGDAARIEYESPAEGRVTFSWDGSLTARGDAIDLHPPDRIHNPFVRVPFEGRRYEIQAGDSSLVLDFDGWRRESS